MKNLELFNVLNTEIKDINSKIESLNESLCVKNEEMKNILKDILVETNPIFEEAIIKWTLDNPIEAISYYMTIKYNTQEIFYKNDNKHIELFENDSYDEDACYALINKNTLEVKAIETYDIVEFYSDLNCGDEVFIELEFLDNYKLPLIKEVGKFISDCAWTIEYKALKYEIYSKAIFNIIENNFIVNENYFASDKDINLSKENIDNLLEEYQNELELSYESKRTFAIQKNSKVIGFIELTICKNEFGEFEMEILSFEIFEEYRSMGYGSEVIALLKEMCNILIQGCTKADDKSLNFWVKNGAIYDVCMDCEGHDNHQGEESKCGTPLKYCFYIES